MRILHVSPSFAPAWAYGGVPRCAYELCVGLASLGETVEVWTTDAFDEHTRITEGAPIAGVTVRRFRNVSNRLAYQAQVYWPLALTRYARAHVSEFDVIHIHAHRHLLQSWTVRAAQRAGVAYVCSGHGTVPAIERRLPVKHIVDCLGARRMLQRADACIAVSQSEVPHYRDAGVDPSRITVIPNGIRLDDYRVLPQRGEFRRSCGIALDAPLVLFMGKITPRKGVDVLIRSLAQLPPSIQLAVCGNFMMSEGMIRRLVAEHRLADRVHFTGILTGRAKLAAYVDADVVAYPSVDEIFGLVPAEAWMCGAPAVVCDDSGCGELVRAAGGGLVVRYGDPNALMAALAALLSDRAKRDQCAAQGRRFVVQHLGWERIASQTQALYRRIARLEVRQSARVR